MTRAVCRDDRLERARLGGLTAAESSELGVHLAMCPDCRLAWRMWVEFQGTAGARPGDERVVDRAARAALGAMRRPPPRWMGAIPAAAALIVAAGVASAAIALHARYTAPSARVPAPAVADPPRRRPRQVPRTSAEATPAPPVPAPTAAAAEVPTPSVRPEQPEIAAASDTTAPARPVRRAAPPPPAVPRAAPRVALALPAGLEPSLPRPRAARAQRLFAQAVRARNEGRTDAAIGFFRDLQRELTETDEAMVSLVSVGELLLSRGSFAEALDAFDAYAARAPGGVLAPEALAGRVRALARLGRTRESEQAAAELARRFPQSPYARSQHAPAIDDGRQPRP